MLGLVSVTFRKLLPEEIILLVSRAGLSCIEWGSDIHVPETEPINAEKIGELTAAAGLKVSSYGTYYHLLVSQKEQFEQYLHCASLLKAPNLRIWAGTLSPAAADADYRTKAAAELSDLCKMAADRGLTVSLEYHRGTLTQTAESTAALLDCVAADNLFTYWQPNPEISHTDHLAEIALLKDRISNIHVFQWEHNGTRRPLSIGTDVWKDCTDALGGFFSDRDFLIEFVEDDSESAFLDDAATLKCWASR